MNPCAVVSPFDGQRLRGLLTNAPKPITMYAPTREKGLRPSKRVNQMAYIRIHRQVFNVLSPYKPGDPLTLESANALNALRAERVRNACFREVTALLADGKIEEAQEIVRFKDENYQFSAKTRGSVTIDPLEHEIGLIARDEAFARFGLDATDEQITELARSEEIKEKAQARLKIRDRVARESIDKLFGEVA